MIHIITHIITYIITHITVLYLFDVVQVLRLDRSIINDDRVHMEVLSKTTNRVPVSPHNTFGYELVKKTIEDIFHHINVFVVPGNYHLHNN